MTALPPRGAAPTGSSLPQTATAVATADRPGPRQLDGIQNPVLIIERRVADEISVGKPATFVTTIRNAGPVPALGVVARDKVPLGTRFVESIPPAAPGADGTLEWALGDIPPGDERAITVQLVPQVEGEIGSVAAVYFATQASTRTVATRPQLQIELVGQSRALIGDSHVVNVTVQNVGSGTAENVRLEADLPPQVRHQSGDANLEAVMGDIRPGETKRVALAVSAVAPGSGSCAVRAVNDDGVLAEQNAPIEVQAPSLAAVIQGPKLRYLERQATFSIGVRNTGTAPATNLDFVAHLPAGLKFISTNNHGAYDPATHSVRWGLHELPAGQTAPIELTLLPVELGSQVVRFTAQGDLNVAAEAEAQVSVEGLAQLEFSIAQDNGTIETGAQTTYTLELANVGNEQDRDVRVEVELPPGCSVLAVQAPVDYQANGNRLAFAPIAEMADNRRLIFRFQVQHDQPGTRVIRAKVTSANWPVAMVKEVGTLVYNDQN